MTISGSYNYNLTRNEIITQSLRNIGILSDGENATGDQIAEGKVKLNVMVKSWRNKGISLPLYQELVVFLERGEDSYLIGATGDKATTLNDYVKTELSAIAALGASTITVDSVTGIANGDVIGVVQDDYTIHWTTVNGAPSGSTIPLTAVTTVAAAVDSHVYTYTSIAQRPLTVKGARLRVNDGNETPLRVATRQEYFGYTNKTSTGQITAVYYDPQIDNGVLYTYQTSNNVNDVILLTVQRQVADYDSPNDTSDFPVEWLDAIIKNLAKEWLTKYGVDSETAAQVRLDAKEALQDAEDFDMEDSFSFAPASEGYED